MTHYLKTIPSYFIPIMEGSKTAEVRNNKDRGFNVGDRVIFEEYDEPMVTGRKVEADITYVFNYEQKENYVVFCYKITKKEENINDN